MAAKSKWQKIELDIEKHRSELNYKKAVETAQSIEHKTTELGNVYYYFFHFALCVKDVNLLPSS
jgi:hypothetical protein